MSKLYDLLNELGGDWSNDGLNVHYEDDIKHLEKLIKRLFIETINSKVGTFETSTGELFVNYEQLKKEIENL